TPAPAVQGFHQAQVGEYITFGAYEQDNNKSNGKEPIQWRVLAKENNRLLVISRYGLDCKQFSRSTRSWRKSDLRKWLNGDFLSQAFTPQELEQIPTTSVFTPTTHNGTEGDTTQDRVFLLSTQEAERYFKSDADRLCQVTAYAKKQKATTIDGDIGWWWLRSPGISEYSTVKVFTTGKIDKSGYNPNSTRGSIRPALWIEMNP
ncbi:MAG: serine/threonine protein kinase, partial [Clostridia bacterium]|nr:serine/threonine protein kinase [Clostridia bacterium]